MPNKLSALGLAVLVAAGCAAPLAPTIVRYPQFNYPPADAKAVTIYKEPPPGAFEAIGEVRARIPASAPMDQFEQALREEVARIGGDGVVLVVQERVTEQKIQRPAIGAQQPVGASSTPGGGVATLPAQAGRMEEVTIRVHEKEITGVVIRFKK